MHYFKFIITSQVGIQVLALILPDRTRLRENRDIRIGTEGFSNLRSDRFLIGKAFRFPQRINYPTSFNILCDFGFRPRTRLFSRFPSFKFNSPSSKCKFSATENRRGFYGY